MTFLLAPGEKLLWALRLELEGGFLSFLPFMFTPSKTIRLTDRRLAVTDSYKRGNEVTTYIPLETIIRMQQGRYSSPRWLYAAIGFIVLGLILTVLTLIGGIPFFVIGGFCLIAYRGSGTESLIIDSGAESPIMLAIGSTVNRVEDLDGTRMPDTALTELILEIELARQLRGDPVKQPLDAEPDEGQAGPLMQTEGD